MLRLYPGTNYYDGAVNYAKISVRGSQGLKSLSPLPFANQLDIELEKPAESATKILITNVSMKGFSEEYCMMEGESGITIYTANYPKGIYAVSLSINGKIIETKRVIRE